MQRHIYLHGHGYKCTARPPHEPTSLALTRILTATHHLEEYVRRQAYGASLFIPITLDILSVEIFEGLSVDFLHFVKDVVHAYFPLAYDAPMGIFGGAEIRLHLVVAKLVDNEHEYLPLVRVIFKVFRQDRAKTVVVVVPLHMNATRVTN